MSNTFIKELLEFKGVELVLLSKNFLSVNKSEDVSWNELKPMVISHLNHYFENNNEPILQENKKRELQQNDDETVKIIDVLDTKLDQQSLETSDIKFKSFDNGVVKVELQGSCSGCPSSLMTLNKEYKIFLNIMLKRLTQ